MGKSLKAAEESSKKKWSTSEVRKEGSKWILSSVCKLGGATVNSNSTREFIGENAYRDDINSTYDPPLAGLSRTHLVTDNKWLGPCK